MEHLEMQRPYIVATVNLLSKADGGRTESTPSDKLHCIFTLDGANFDCRMMFGDAGALKPGETRQVSIIFLSPELVLPRLEAGTEFQIREIRLIGRGVVDRVVSTPP